MKKVFLGGVLLLSAAMFSCKNSTQFVINGEIKNPSGDNKVYLLVVDSLGNMNTLDSTFLNEDQKFILKGKAETPEFYQLYAGGKSYMLIAENGDEISFKTDMADHSNAYDLSGTKEADKITEFNKITTELTNESNKLAEKYTKLITDNADKKDSIIADFQEKSQVLIQPILKKSVDFIKNNEKSLTAFFAANVILGADPTTYEKEIIAYSEVAKKEYPNNKMISAFANQMESLKKVAIGEMAPNFTAKTPDGKDVSLSDYKGKYVLLDFWASWCGPCRQENPHIVATYQALKNKNFDVLGFSLDVDSELWKKAIQTDKLTWTHVSELKQWDAPTARLYNINAIPASFIIDPSGKIIAKNLRGKALSDFLSKVL